MRKYLLLIPFLLFAGEYGKIAGKVVDGKTGEPIHRADVVVENANRGASTNESGEYEIFYVPVGTYLVTVTHQNYESERCFNTEINPDENTVLDFHLDFVSSSAFFEKYISKYVSDNEIKEFSDSLLVIYDFTFKQLDDPLLSEMKKYDIAWTIHRIINKLSKIGDVRAESLALECSQSNNIILKDAALHVFAATKSLKGVDPLLQLLKWGPLQEGPIVSYVTIPPFWTIYECTVMEAIAQIGKSALPYLKTAVVDRNEKFRQRVAILISRIGTQDTLLSCQAGEILTKMIEERNDPFYLEDAIRGAAALNYRPGIPAIISILFDKEIKDHPAYTIPGFPFIPNRVSIRMLNKFGLKADYRFERELGWVYEFEDTSGVLHRIIKTEGKVPIITEAYDEVLKYYQRIVVDNPKDWVSWSYIAVYHIKLKEYEKAIDIYENKVLEMNPNSVDAMGNLAYCYRELGDNKKALEWLMKAEEIRKEMTK